MLDYTRNYFEFEKIAKNACEVSGYNYNAIDYIKNHKRNCLVYVDYSGFNKMALVECTNGKIYKIGDDCYTRELHQIINA
jgi:hypothetical protein